MRRLRLPATLLLLASLAACSDGARKSSNDPEPRTSAPVTGSITVQAAGGEGELNALRSMIDAFQKAHPGTTVTFTGLVAIVLSLFTGIGDFGWFIGCGLGFAMFALLERVRPMITVPPTEEENVSDGTVSTA